MQALFQLTHGPVPLCDTSFPGSGRRSLLLPGEFSKYFWGCRTAGSSRPTAESLVTGLPMLCSRLGTLLVPAFAGDPSHHSHFLTSRYSVVIIFVNQPTPGALGQRGESLKTSRQDDKKKWKVNKNNSKSTYELKAGI